MEECAREIDRLRPDQPSILDDRRIQFTDKKKQLSTKDLNREIFAMALPPDHALQDAIRLWDSFKKDQKLLSSYTFPLLRGNRKEAEYVAAGNAPRKFYSPSALVEGFAYPSWYPVPSQVKDGEGDDGGTEQGRFTAKNPAVQTLPASIKDCIEAPEEGGSILWADFSQIELRVAAVLSGDPTLLHSFRTNSDLHTEQAIRIFGEEHLRSKYPELRDELNLKKWKDLSPGFDKLERQCGKHDNFTQLNLGGADTLQKTILKKGHVSVPIEFCHQAVAARPVARPVLYAWQMAQIEKAKKDHILVLPVSGLSCYFSGAAHVVDETFRSKAVNFPIQTWAGLIVREFQILCQRRFCPLSAKNPPVRQFINVYDATAFYMKPGIDIRLDLAEVFDSLSTGSGIWARFQEAYGHECPLAFDTRLIVRKPEVSS